MENGGDYNIAIRDMAETGSSYLLVDQLDIEKLAKRNLAALTIAGQMQPITGNTYPYSVKNSEQGNGRRVGLYGESARPERGDARVGRWGGKHTGRGETVVQLEWTATGRSHVFARQRENAGRRDSRR